MSGLQVKGIATGNNCRRTLRRMLSAAQQWGISDATPKIKLLKQGRRSLLIDGERETRLLAVAPQSMRDVLIVMQDTGLRPDEVLRMRWENIDWLGKTVFNPHGKTERSRRRVPMSDCLFRMLQRRRDPVCTEGWVFRSAKKHSRSGHISLSTIEHQFKSARMKAGLPKELVLYCSRHTYATDALARTGNVAAVMDSMGHASAQTTMIYQHQGLEQLRAAINERSDENNREQEKLLGQKLGQTDPACAIKGAASD